jgi:UDP-glucose 4-epimerase
MLAKTFCSTHHMEIIGLRYFNVYGRKQNPDSEYAAVIPTFIVKAIGNEPLPVQGDGLQTRDFVYVDDVVQANLLALSGPCIAGGCFNIASGTSTSILDLAQFIIKITGSASSVVHMPPRPGDIKESRADIWSARRELGYSPAYDVGRGLEDTVKWFRKERARAAEPVHVRSARREARLAC